MAAFEKRQPFFYIDAKMDSISKMEPISENTRYVSTAACGHFDYAQCPRLRNGKMDSISKMEPISWEPHNID
jgi:hypothetical protein